MSFRRLSRLALAMVAAVAAVVLTTSFAAAYVYTPRSSTSPNMPQCYDNLAVSATCEAQALRSFDTARAKEGVGRMTLPSNFLHLTRSQQLIVLVNIERIDRGLRPFLGLSATLDGIATHGAITTTDPKFPSWTGTAQHGSILATGMNPMFNEFMWMYDDGYISSGSWNGECFTPTAPKCWVHRHAELRETASPLLAGVGWTAKANWGGPNLAALFLSDDHHDTANAWKWSSEVRYFPLGSRENPRP